MNRRAATLGSACARVRDFGDPPNLWRAPIKRARDCRSSAHPFAFVYSVVNLLST